MSEGPAPLPRHYVDKALEHVRSSIARSMGVTLQEDHNGAWGPIGKRYLTVRFRHPDGDPQDMTEVMLEVVSVGSYLEDEYRDRLAREDK